VPVNPREPARFSVHNLALKRSARGPGIGQLIAARMRGDFFSFLFLYRGGDYA